MLSTKTLALASAMAMTVTAENEPDVFNTSADWLGEDDFRHLEVDKRGRFQANFFKKDKWHANTAEDKHAFLWSMLVPDETVEVEPQAYYWKEFPQLFTTRSGGSFCRAADDIAWSRKKIAHT